MPQLLVIIGSTRPGRVGLPVANWFVERARAHGAFDVHVADLKEINLPFLDEPNHPARQQYEHDHTRRWSETVSAADAVVFVTAEYNFSVPAPLKNAVDYLNNEWNYTPAGIVSYGGVSAGTRAAMTLRQSLNLVRMPVIADTVSIPFVQQFLSEDRSRIEANDVMNTAADAVLDELARWVPAMELLTRD